MRYDVMEYFSVYGTALSMWVTLIGESQDSSPEEATECNSWTAAGSEKVVLQRDGGEEM